MSSIKKFLYTIFILGVFITVSVSAQAPSDFTAPSLIQVAGQKGDIADCFDYYKFGSLALDIYTDKLRYEQNDGVIFQGTIKNNNPYPVVDIALFGRIYAKDLIVDEFYAAKGINLAAGAEAEIKYPWMIHSNAASGDYRANFYVVSADKFNMSGLSFTDDVYASFAEFKITGVKPDTVYLDRTNTEINGQSYSYTGFLSPYEANKPINITIPLVNSTGNQEEVEVSYKLYYWDGLSEENIQKQTKETITLKANSSQILKYAISNPNQSVYYLEIIAKPLNQKIINIVQRSITNIRITTNANRGRLNFLGLSDFPLKSGQSYDFFVCFHNTSVGLLEKNKVSAVLRNGDGETLSEINYPGAIPSAISALKVSFRSPDDYDYLIVEAVVTDNNNKVVDKISQIYDCAQFSPSLCYAKGGASKQFLKIFSSPWGIGMLSAAILVIIFLAIVKRKKRQIEPTQTT